MEISGQLRLRRARRRLTSIASQTKPDGANGWFLAAGSTFNRCINDDLIAPKILTRRIDMSILQQDNSQPN
jgi:hypothetical protein